MEMEHYKIPTNLLVVNVHYQIKLLYNKTIVAHSLLNSMFITTLSVGNIPLGLRPRGILPHLGE